MNELKLAAQIYARGALFRLKIWFDPSLEGSPYESPLSSYNQKKDKNGMFSLRRFMVRI